jgi:hypothetical protein
VGIFVALLSGTPARADTWTTTAGTQITTSTSTTRVGIGLTPVVGPPVAALDVRNATSANDGFRVNQTIAGTGTVLARFRNNTTDRMVLTTAGSLGIGIATPAEKLHVVGNIYATGTVNGFATMSNVNAVNGNSSAGHGVSGISSGGGAQAGVFGYAGPASNGANGVIAANDDEEAANGLAAYRVQTYTPGGDLVPAQSGSAIAALGGQFAIDAVTGQGSANQNTVPPYVGTVAVLATNYVSDCTAFGQNCAAVVGQVKDMSQAWAGRFMGDVDVTGSGYFVNGNFVASDARLKKDVQDLRYGLEQVLKLRPVTYKWKDGHDDRTKIGVIAQEIDKVLPEVVTTNRTSGMLAVEYQEIIPVAIKAIQEQENVIRRQAATIQQLDARLTALEKSRGAQTASLFSGGFGASSMLLALLPIGLFVAWRRQNRKGQPSALIPSPSPRRAG